MWIFLGSSGCSLVQKSPIATLYLSSMRFTSKAITQMETRFFWRNRVTELRRQWQRPALLRASQFAASYAAAQLSIDKRMSCTASDAALSILRAHYEMQINRNFTLIRDVGATANEIPERRRWAAPPTQKFVRRKWGFTDKLFKMNKLYYTEKGWLIKTS